MPRAAALVQGGTPAVSRASAPAVDDDSPVPVVLITGMSGAGKSTALKMLEDLGYEAIDNLPLRLLRRLLAPEDDRLSAIAVDVDVRTRDFDVESFIAETAPLAEREDLALDLVFLDCDDGVLRRRFTETRRRHPLARDRPVMDGIAHERRLMLRLRDNADIVIDTSHLAIPEFRRLMTRRFALGAGPEMAVSVTSFSYRRGLPREADLVFDVRFLANPHYVECLRSRSGKDRRVAAYVEKDAAFGPFLESLTGMLRDLLPRYAGEGKSYLTVAIGCTGGRHRSVHVAERLARVLGSEGHVVSVSHRDLGPTET